jgi:hypothetical protein
MPDLAIKIHNRESHGPCVCIPEARCFYCRLYDECPICADNEGRQPIKHEAVRLDQILLTAPLAGDGPESPEEMASEPATPTRGGGSVRRVYIAGPMTGLPEFNYPAFYAAAEAWRAAGWDVINPAESFDGDDSRPYRDYVEVDLATLKTCDAIAMLPGWDGANARGAVWEREVARTLLNLPVLDARYPIRPALIDPPKPAPAKVRTFDTGATRDTDAGKLDYEGFEHPSVMRRFAEFMHSKRPQPDGSLRDSDNWQLGMPRQAYMKSMWRHLMEVWSAHRAGVFSGKELEEALCAIRFNVNGYLFEVVKDRR